MTPQEIRVLLDNLDDIAGVLRNLERLEAIIDALDGVTNALDGIASAMEEKIVNVSSTEVIRNEDN